MKNKKGSRFSWPLYTRKRLSVLFISIPHQCTGQTTELKMTEWKTTVHISSSSQSSIAAQQKIVLADRSLCSRQQSGGGEGEAEWGGPRVYRLAHPPH